MAGGRGGRVGVSDAGQLASLQRALVYGLVLAQIVNVRPLSTVALYLTELEIESMLVVNDLCCLHLRLHARLTQTVVVTAAALAHV